MSNDLLSRDLPVKYRNPAAIIWNRLEPRPRAENFERSLRAEIRDALWMISRQWQLGEFKGEDAGSAIFARAQLETTQITHFAQGGEEAVAYDGNLPLETQVEQEEIEFDTLLRLQMGQHWLRLLKHHGLNDKYRNFYCKLYPLEIPAVQNIDNVEFFAIRQLWQLNAAIAGRGMDGGKFYAALISGTDPATVTAGDGSKIADEDKPSVNEAKNDFENYFNRLFTQPREKKTTAWNPQHLEYQFACSLPNSDGTQTVLGADEYYHGHLDWYSFDIEPKESMRLKNRTGEIINGNNPRSEIITFIPSEAAFAGMPNSRWWEFEDRTVDFGDFDAQTTDIAKLLLMEMGLIHGKDWLFFPYVVPVGSLCEIKTLVVTDVFGQRTLIRAAGKGENETWQRWNMFGINKRGDSGKVDNRLFLTPTVVKLLESPPLEKVTFLRDEMANMVWAVESIIPNGVSGGMDGYEAAVDLHNYCKRSGLLKSDKSSVESADAKIRYRIKTGVPANWIPLVPTHVADSNREIQLQLAAMPSMIQNCGTVKPRGKILQPELANEQPYFIYEEEVPRAGAIVTRTYQLTRWHNGKTYLWVGRRKQTGRGEGSSGLRFDVIEPYKNYVFREDRAVLRK